MNLSEPTLDDVFLRQTGLTLRDSDTTGAPDGSEAAA
jgi:hypothetical protein